MTRWIVKHESQGIRVFPVGSNIESTTTRAFDMPLTAEDLEELRFYIEDYPSKRFGVYRDRAVRVEAMLPEWANLLRETVLDAHLSTEMRIPSQEDDPPSLTFVSDSPTFLSRPWELIARYPAPNRLRISRAHRSMSAPPPAFSNGPLRLLWVLARPENDRDIPFGMVAAEAAPLLLTGIEVEVLRPPTLSTLRKRLRDAAEEDAPFHILHLDTHGAAENGGTVVLETDGSVFRPEGGRDEVSIQRLTAEVGPVMPPLVVLNACRSARFAPKAETESALALGLLETDVRAVVAMSFNVRGETAAAFMRTFYQNLVKGASLEAAVEAARDHLASRQGESDPPDWLIPVLYGQPDITLEPPRASSAVPTPRLPSVCALNNDVMIKVERWMGWNLKHPTDRLALLVHGTIGAGKTFFIERYLDWYDATRSPKTPIRTLALDTQSPAEALNRVSAQLESLKRLAPTGDIRGLLVLDGVAPLGADEHTQSAFDRILEDALRFDIVPLLVGRSPMRGLKARVFRVTYSGMERSAQDQLLAEIRPVNALHRVVRTFERADRQRLGVFALIKDSSEIETLRDLAARFQVDAWRANTETWAQSMDRAVDLGLAYTPEPSVYSPHPLLGTALAERWPLTTPLQACNQRLIEILANRIESLKGRGEDVEFTDRLPATLSHGFDIAMATQSFTTAAVLFSALDAHFGRQTASPVIHDCIDKITGCAASVSGHTPSTQRALRGLWLTAMASKSRLEISSGALSQAKATLAALARSVSHPDELAVVAHLSSDYFRACGRYDKALEWYVLAKNKHLEMGDRSKAAAAMHEIGLIYMASGDPVTAEAWLKEEAATLPDQDLAGKARCYFELARSAALQENYEQALAWSDRRQDLDCELKDKTGLARLQYYQSAVCREKGNLEGAERWANELVREAKRLDDTALIGNGFQAHGRIAEARDDLEAAVSWYNHALPLCDRNDRETTRALLQNARNKLADYRTERKKR